jgi:hypothetical protein
MKLKHHKNLSLEKWSGIPLERRILMIANEMNRAGNWISKKDISEARLCYERAIELTCLTGSLPMHHNFRREFLRWKEMLGGLFLCPHPTIRQNTLMQDVLVSLSPQAYRLLHPHTSC